MIFHSFIQKSHQIFSYAKLIFLSVIIISSFGFAGNVWATNNVLNTPIAKYPAVYYYDTVFTDTSRVRDGAKYNSGVPLNGFRQIDVRIYRPASAPGTGAPIRIPLVPLVYDGLHANQPLVTSTVGFQLERTWSNNSPLAGPFPLIIMFGGGGSSVNVLKLAEDIAAAGYIVAVPSGFGIDTAACPIASGFCSAAVARTQDRDARVVISAAVNGLLGFSGTEITKDTSGVAIAGCVGGSAGAGVCHRAAAGAGITDANSLPGETVADPRIRAIFMGDTYQGANSPTINASHLTAAVGMYNSVLGRNFPADYSSFSNATIRIFYDLTNAEHRGSDISSANLCDHTRELIRVVRDGVNTPRDNISIAGLTAVQIGASFAHCSSNDLVGFNLLPLALPDSLTGLLPNAPLTGILYNSPNSDFDHMTNYYIITFLRATLENDANALAATTTPSFPGLMDNIYVNSVPGADEHDFNLQSKQIDFKLATGGDKYNTMIISRSGPIADPSTTPGAFSLFGNAAWDDNQGLITLAFDFPLPKGNLVKSTRTIFVNSNGFILPESVMAIIDASYTAKRIGNWFADRGSRTYACLGSDMFSGTVTPSSSAHKVWIVNTPQYLQVTWYQVSSRSFGTAVISSQCTLYPDGSIRMEFDNSVPAILSTVFPGLAAASQGSAIVGISSGRLHVNGSGKYNFNQNADINTLTDVLNGQSKNADAIYEVYSAPVSAIGVSGPGNNGNQYGQDKLFVNQMDGVDDNNGAW
jgi:hypothetical protein